MISAPFPFSMCIEIVSHGIHALNLSSPTLERLKSIKYQRYLNKNQFSTDLNGNMCDGAHTTLLFGIAVRDVCEWKFLRLISVFHRLRSDFLWKIWLWTHLKARTYISCYVKMSSDLSLVVWFVMPIEQLRLIETKRTSYGRRSHKCYALDFVVFSNWLLFKPTTDSAKLATVKMHASSQPLVLTNK